MRLLPLARVAIIASTLALFAACSKNSTPTSPTPQRGADGPQTIAADSVTLLEDFSARQVFPTNNWWNLDISMAPVAHNRRRSSTSLAAARRAIPRRRASCTRTSARLPTASPTSASAPTRRCFPSRSLPMAPARRRRRSRPPARLSHSERGADRTELHRGRRARRRARVAIDI